MLWIYFIGIFRKQIKSIVRLFHIVSSSGFDVALGKWKAPKPMEWQTISAFGNCSVYKSAKFKVKSSYMIENLFPALTYTSNKLDSF